jgi:phosphoribosyl-ATP pyrophosphohydrolase
MPNATPARALASPEPSDVISALTTTIQDRITHPREGSYTNRLLSAGKAEMLKKVGEEAAEVIVAGAMESNERLVYETADLLYHLLVLLSSQGLTWADIEAELARRFK